jgi:hypothetical protein
VDRWSPSSAPSSRLCAPARRSPGAATPEARHRREKVIARENRKKKARSPAPPKPPGRAGADLTPGVYALLLLVFLGAALIVYRPALDGPFLSDDGHYVERNVFIHTLSVENFVAIIDPTGPATVDVVNYSPVQLLLHALAWRAFGPETTGHHVVNVVLHVVASLLLVPLFLRSGVRRAGALLGSAFFLLHPANVEAVAWISQLKSSSSLVLSLAALLVFPKRRALGSALFVLALLAKPTAAYALPVAVLLSWTRGERIPWRWFALWAAAFAAYSAAEFSVHQRSGAAEAVLYDTPFVLVRTILGLAMRYLVMASTSLGVSAFHEPEPIRSPLDPWWICSLLALALLGWRTLVVWRRRAPEVAYWVWALVSFGPVSQIFPFLYPLADRYLYFILPGLIGGGLLAAQEALEKLPAEGDWRRRAARAGVALGVVLCALFALHSHERAGIWRYSATLLADAARHYPDGVSANLIRAHQAAQNGDAEGTVAALRAAESRGFNRFEMLVNDTGFDSVRNHPKFQELVEEMAAGRIASVEGRERPTQAELRMAAHAHIVRREYAAARRMLKRALEQGGPYDYYIRSDLEQLARVLD